ncbi:alpha/beta hydrolase [Vibrio sp. 10N.222.54.A1]|uniref:esterase/lipase family protein n=1 Tax=unclassified Vibrio TaxID=2614977 RepID=UPI000C8676EC|nr:MULTISPECIES: alpha/beta hydrolase [unclassified Vibrio]PMK78032.1 hypothetical protein BCT92_03805 [Vibrio sp. 10N.261.52.E5]TKF83033.1 alpha/beta hydrolase [Vibrio sp. F13]
MKLYIPSATLSVLLLSPSFASAEDIPDSHELRNFSMRSQSSGIAPPQEVLGVYVVNSGPGLDTGCTYASGGPLLISLPVPMVVSPNVLQSDGRIAPSKLGDMQQKGVIGSNARISMPVFDIDSNANVSNIAPEIDIVSFNGKSLGTLQGADNRWTDTNLQVDISDIKFGQNNEIRVDIDTGNTGDNWCMSVDWVSIEFDVAIPVILAHGIAAQSDTWDDDTAPGVLSTLDDYGIRYTRFSADKNGTTATNANILNNKIQGFLDELKSDKVHVIAHSKGGLDTQNLKALSPSFEITSLSTFSTPHLGSVAADLSVIKMDHYADIYSNVSTDPNNYAGKYMQLPNIPFAGPKMPGIRDLTTDTASNAIQMRTRGNIANTFSIGANADLNQDGVIEKDPDIVGLFPWGSRWAGVTAWQALRSFSSAAYLDTQTQSVTMPSVHGPQAHPITIVSYQAIQTVPQENDVVVTLASANPSYTNALGNVLANHSTMKTGQNVEHFLQQIISMR